MEISWTQFKQFLSDRNVGCNYVEIGNNYHLNAFDNSFKVDCILPLDRNLSLDTIDFEDNYKASSNQKIKNTVQTEFERTDIVLKIASDSTIFDGNNDAVLNFQVPGTPGTTDGRYVAGGYAFTDVMGFGDKVTEINVIDIDDLLGYGANTVIQTYHETDMSESNKGWYFWPSPQAGGEIEIDPMGYYGFLPSGLYLQIKFKKTVASGATKVYCNCWWGT